MKSRNFFIAIAVIIGIITMAAGVAVIIDRYLKKKECAVGYIESDCTPDEMDVQ